MNNLLEVAIESCPDVEFLTRDDRSLPEIIINTSILNPEVVNEILTSFNINVNHTYDEQTIEDMIKSVELHCRLYRLYTMTASNITKYFVHGIQSESEFTPEDFTSFKNEFTGSVVALSRSITLLKRFGTNVKRKQKKQLSSDFTE